VSEIRRFVTERAAAHRQVIRAPGPPGGAWPSPARPSHIPRGQLGAREVAVALVPYPSIHAQAGVPGRFVPFALFLSVAFLSETT
jgi:hypothetical protein